MALRLIESAARAFGMLAFVVVSLWLTHGKFPRNWLLLGCMYLTFIPVALLYGWLTDPRPAPDMGSTSRRISPLLVIGVGAAIAICGYSMFAPAIDAAFYPKLGATR
jgi:hypothetical protein